MPGGEGFDLGGGGREGGEGGREGNKEGVREQRRERSRVDEVQCTCRCGRVHTCTLHFNSSQLTFRVPDIEFWDSTSLRINMIGPSKQCGHALYKPDAACNVEWRVAITITHERISIGLQEILDHFLLPRENSKMEGRLEGEGGEGGREGGREAVKEGGSEGGRYSTLKAVIYHRVLSSFISPPSNHTCTCT